MSSMRNDGVPVECPNCHADLNDHEHPGYYRTIAVYDRDKDATVAWRCPDCWHEWER